MLLNTTQYGIAGTETFRLSHRQLFGVWGTNLGNIPKKLRKLYKAPEGKRFVQTDQAGAEALIVAYLCKPGNLRDIFTYGINPHVYAAMHIFKQQWIKHISPSILAEALNTSIKDLTKLSSWKDITKIIKSSDDWPPSERYYYMGKKSNHSGNYDIKAPTFLLDVLKESEGAVVLTRPQAEEILNGRAKLFPEIMLWHLGIQKLWLEAKKGSTVTLHNLFGFPREFGGGADLKTFKEAYAFVPQSTVGTITNIAFTNLQIFIEVSCGEHYSKLPEKVKEALDMFSTKPRHWDMLNNCHDSYLTQCSEEDTEECAAVQKFFMEQDLIAPRGEHFRMRSETLTGKNWGPYKKETNEDGLR